MKKRGQTQCHKFTRSESGGRQSKRERAMIYCAHSEPMLNSNDQKWKWERERKSILQKNTIRWFIGFYYYILLCFSLDTSHKRTNERRKNYKWMFEKHFYYALKETDTLVTFLFSNTVFFCISKRSKKTKKTSDNTLFICLCFSSTFFGLNVSIDFRNKRFKMFSSFCFFCVFLFIQFNGKCFYLWRCSIDDRRQLQNSLNGNQKTKIVWAESCPSPLSSRFGHCSFVWCTDSMQWNKIFIRNVFIHKLNQWREKEKKLNSAMLRWWRK